MISTKQKILNTSKLLLNQYGLAAVSQRTIADHMGISPGNLTYHFKKRSDIIEALYFELVEKIDQVITEIPLGEGLLKGLHALTYKSMEYFFEYRFLMLDFSQVMREFKNIKKHYIKLSDQREAQFQFFFKTLQEDGLMRAEEIPNEYQNLIQRMMILGNFWLASAEISREKMTKKQIEKYLEITTQAIFPYLTKKGKQYFLEIIAYI